jgi:hypothetical protein
MPFVRKVSHRLLLIALAVLLSVAAPRSASASGGGHGGGGHDSGGHGGGHGGGDAHGAKAEEEEIISAESADGTRAVKLGEFSIRVYHSVSSRKDTVAFVLQARIDKEGFEVFERIYPHRVNKVRDQVILATRLVPIEDYDDPELKKFRRRIYLRLRRSIPELPIADVYLSDFSLAVQSM